MNWVEENGGKWGLEHSLRGRRNPGSSNQPSSQTLYHIKFILSSTFISTIWTKSSQYLISKCYKIVQKLWKTITKSYNIYAKYPEKSQKTFRDFLHNFVMFFIVCFIYMGIRDIFYTPPLHGG